MKARWRTRVLLCALLVVSAAQADAQLATNFGFASVEQGRAIVSARDEYIERLSPLERTLKARSESPVSEADFLKLLAATVKPWSAADRAAIQRALDSIAPAIAQLGLPLPRSVTFVRTSGVGEGNAPHTRASAIIITDSALKQPQGLPALLAHELFHVASRQDRAWRDAMYATIGFMPIEEIALPPELAARRITNPDAPRLDVAIRVETAEGPAWVTPLLLATVDRYDLRCGKFFAVMQLTWIEVGRGARPQRGELANPPRLRSTADLRQFAEQVGRNTGYIIHPEEILAENFAQLVTGKSGPTPKVHERLRAALKRNTPAGSR
jgi:hypothetical protein